MQTQARINYENRKREWQDEDDQRHPWHLKTDIGPRGFPRKTTVQKRVKYLGYWIEQRPYTNILENKEDTMGFEPTVVYVVVDDFGDKALSIVTQQFWNPWDARNAIDLVEFLKGKVPKPKWPTSISHEHQLMLLLRRKPAAVYAAIHDIKKIMLEAHDFKENPAKAIGTRLHGLNIELYGPTGEPL